MSCRAAGDDQVLHGADSVPYPKSSDLHLCSAFQAKARAETVNGRTQTDPKQYEANVKHALEVATVLRQNFVQALRVQSGEQESNGTDLFSAYQLD
jgi:hypothetical protein